MSKTNKSSGLEYLDINLSENIKINEEVKKTNIISFDDSKQGVERGIIQIDIKKLISAPDEWNFFSKLNTDMYEELKDNILENGLNSPIIVYKNSEDEYMIISGHNRANIFKDLNKLDPTKWKTISAIVETKNSISELGIRERIIDMNVMGRKLTNMDISKSIYYKWLIQKENNSRGSGRTSEHLGKKLNISGKQINRYKSLFFLIPELQDMIEKETLTVETGHKLSTFENDIQKWLYDHHREKLKFSNLKKLHAAMTIEEIDVILNQTPMKKIAVKYEIPKHLKNEFDQYVTAWMHEKNIIIK